MHSGKGTLHIESALGEIDFEILEAVKKRPGATLKEIYNPLARPGWKETCLYQRMRRLAFAKFLEIRSSKCNSREYEVRLTQKGKGRLANRGGGR